MQSPTHFESSKSDVFLRRLVSLRLPAMRDKTYLDVGCGAGFFCGYAQFEGAKRVIGIDSSDALLREATSNHPGVDFRHQPLDRLPDEKFDVITLLTKLEGAQTREKLLHDLVARLSDDGVLILEIGLAPDGQDEWVSANRADSEAMFPTPQKLSAVLKDSAWKIIGHGVVQTDDVFPRYIVHVRKLKPYAWLLMENPGAGKSTIIRRVFRQTTTGVISGDELYKRLAQGEYRVSDALRLALQKNFSPQRIDAVTHALFAKGLLKDIVSFWAEHVGYRDFALDSFVPRAYRQEVRAELQALGYFPIDLSWDNPVTIRPLNEAQSSVDAYRQRLEKDLPASGIRYTSVTQASGFKNLPFMAHLDFPVRDKPVEPQSDLRVSGWLIDPQCAESLGEIYVKTMNESLSYPIDRPRPDVLSHVFSGDSRVPPQWQGKNCGFDFIVPMDAAGSGFEIGLVSHRGRTPLWQVHLFTKSQS